MAFKILKKQPRQESGPFTQAQLLAIKAKQPGHQHHIHRPWPTGKTYPYRSAKRGGLSWQERAALAVTA